MGILLQKDPWSDALRRTLPTLIPLGLLGVISILKAMLFVDARATALALFEAPGLPQALALPTHKAYLSTLSTPVAFYTPCMNGCDIWDPEQLQVATFGLAGSCALFAMLLCTTTCVDRTCQHG